MQESDRPKVSYDKFCKLLGYNFQRLVLLKRAMTHASFSSNRLENNQRLEFLGDRVLGLSISKMLYETYPLEPEGDLAVRLSTLVSAKTLAAVAEEIKVPELLELSSQETKRKGFRNKNILADSMEAVLGAVFLDSDFATAYKVIDKFWRVRVEQSRMPMKDFKTKLQEITQKRDGTHPIYKLVKKEGPPHAPTFTLSASVCGITEIAAGPSKKEAEQIIAMKVLEQLELVAKEEAAKKALETVMKKEAEPLPAEPSPDTLHMPAPKPAEAPAKEPAKPKAKKAAKKSAPEPEPGNMAEPEPGNRADEPEPGNRIDDPEPEINGNLINMPAKQRARKPGAGKGPATRRPGAPKSAAKPARAMAKKAAPAKRRKAGASVDGIEPGNRA